MLFYALLAALGLVAVHGASTPRTLAPAPLSPRQRLIFHTLLSADTPAAQLSEWADKFSAQGFKDEADILRKRAAIASAPPEVRAKVKMAFQVGMASKNPQEVRQLANLMEANGYFGNADALRKVASDLDVSAQIQAAQALKMSQAAQVPATPPGKAPVKPTSTPSIPTAPMDPKSVLASATEAELKAAVQSMGGQVPAPAAQAAQAAAAPVAQAAAQAATQAATQAAPQATQAATDAAKTVIGSVL
jgi:hypothetical protein